MAEEPTLTHLDAQGSAHMVDVTAKPWTRRVAVARGRVTSSCAVAAVLAAAGTDVVAAARVAGVSAAKVAWDLIPLCHPIRLLGTEVAIDVSDHVVAIEAVTEVVAPTGVEMEALTACCVAGLVLVQALAPVDPAASLTGVELVRKEGGRSGTWVRGDSPGT